MGVAVTASDDELWQPLSTNNASNGKRWWLTMANDVGWARATVANSDRQWWTVWPLVVVSVGQWWQSIAADSRR